MCFFLLPSYRAQGIRLFNEALEMIKLLGMRLHVEKAQSTHTERDCPACMTRHRLRNWGLNEEEITLRQCFSENRHLGVINSENFKLFLDVQKVIKV